MNKTGIFFPHDFKKALIEINAGKGEIGKNGYIDFFSIDEFAEMNEDYSFVMQQIPDLYMFAKDAADTGYAFHKEKHTYHSFGLMSNFEFDTLVSCGNSFEELISGGYT